LVDQPATTSSTEAALKDSEEELKDTTGLCCFNCKKAEIRSQLLFPSCSRCQMTFYCGKECQKANWKEHKVNILLIISKKICKLSKERKSCAKKAGGDNNLPLKFVHWKEENYNEITTLALSTFQPATNERCAKYVAVIHLKELEVGFEVDSTQEVALEFFAPDLIQDIKKIHADNKVEGDGVICAALVRIKLMKTGEFVESLLAFHCKRSG
jgi:hypothetical protein